MKHLRHLAVRFIKSLSRKLPSNGDLAEVAAILMTAELQLWQQLPPMDQRHSIVVMRRFLERRPGAQPSEARAALLHDIGKIKANLGVVGRVFATLIGRHGERFVAYHDHELIGSELLKDIGSDLITCQLVAGSKDSQFAGALQDLRDSDNI